jgi:hypothetical protein
VAKVSLCQRMSAVTAVPLSSSTPHLVFKVFGKCYPLLLLLLPTVLRR